MNLTANTGFVVSGGIAFLILPQISPEHGRWL